MSVEMLEKEINMASGRQNQPPAKKDYEREARLSFLQLDDKARSAIRQFRPVLEKNMDKVLDAFYAHATSVPKLSSLINNAKVSIAHLKQVQSMHWLNLFNAEFNESYMEKVSSIGRAHERIGLEPRWYLGGYCLALCCLIRLAIKKHWWQPTKCCEVVTSIVKGIFCDMELAITLYNDMIRETSVSKLQQAVDQINKNINDCQKRYSS